MKTRTSLGAAAALLITGQSALALNIVFDYTYDGGFFTGINSTRQGALESAAGFFESHLTDSLSAINSDGFNQFNANFTEPNTGASRTLNNYSVARDTLVVYAGGRALGGSTLGQGGPGGYSVGGTTDFLDNVERRGQAGETQGTNAIEFAPWGGSISFNSVSNWYFDSDPTTLESFAGPDFYSVALHELAHLLGIGTADSWDNLANTGSFIGAAATAVHGGPVPLAGDDHAHWADGTLGLVDGTTQEAAMDPSIILGDRKYFTNLDLAALDDIGWDVVHAPLPPAVFLFGSGLLALLGLGTRRRPA